MFFLIISLLIGFMVLLWIIGLISGQDPWSFAFIGIGITIALGFLLFFLWIMKIMLF